MITRQELETYLLGLPNAILDYPFGEEVAVYKVPVQGEQKMFALVPERKDPISISVKCDPLLASVLRERYESVMEGYHLNKRHWITVLITGQLTDQEVKDLILHSYQLVNQMDSPIPDFI
jgi:predicted DNA-binding protein (MmcQ/YjbR family)